MHQDQKKEIPGGDVILLLVLLNAIIIEQGFVSNPKWYNMIYITLPLLVISILAFWKKIL